MPGKTLSHDVSVSNYNAMVNDWQAKHQAIRGPVRLQRLYMKSMKTISFLRFGLPSVRKRCFSKTRQCQSKNDSKKFVWTDNYSINEDALGLNHQLQVTLKLKKYYFNILTTEKKYFSIRVYELPSSIKSKEIQPAYMNCKTPQNVSLVTGLK